VASLAGDLGVEVLCTAYLTATEWLPPYPYSVESAKVYVGTWYIILYYVVFKQLAPAEYIQINAE